MRLNPYSTIIYGGLISIHAPVKGATTYPIIEIVYVLISIHAPVKGATLRTVDLIADYMKISIHAPVKGATVFFSHYLLLKNTANHFLKSFVSFFFVFCELGLGFLCPGPSLISFTISTSLFLGYRYRPFPDFPLFSPNFFQDYKFL